MQDAATLIQQALKLVQRVDPDVEYNPAELAVVLAELDRLKGAIAHAESSFAERSKKQISQEVERFLEQRKRGDR